MWVGACRARVKKLRWVGGRERARCIRIEPSRYLYTVGLMSLNARAKSSSYTASHGISLRTICSGSQHDLSAQISHIHIHTDHADALLCYLVEDRLLVLVCECSGLLGGLLLVLGHHDVQQPAMIAEEVAAAAAAAAETE